MLSKKAWKDRMHKKKRNDTHRVMRCRPEKEQLGRLVHLSLKIIPEKTKTTSIVCMEVAPGVTYIGNAL